MDKQVTKHQNLLKKYKSKLEKRFSREEIHKGLNISDKTKLTLSWTISKENKTPIMYKKTESNKMLFSSLSRSESILHGFADNETGMEDNKSKLDY